VCPSAESDGQSKQTDSPPVRQEARSDDHYMDN